MARTSGTRTRAVTSLAVGHEAMGWPLSDGASPPGVAERVIGGLVFAYGSLAAVATFCARLAQVFELWSEQRTVTAARSRGRLVARPPALMARVMAAASAAATGVAELLASLYGWRSFGGEVSRRAHLARRQRQMRRGPEPQRRGPPRRQLLAEPWPLSGAEAFIMSAGLPLVASGERKRTEGVADVGQGLAVAGVVELVGQEYGPAPLVG